MQIWFAARSIGIWQPTTTADHGFAAVPGPCPSGRLGASVLGPELGGFGFEGGDFLFELADFAGFVVLAFGAGELLAEELQFLLDDFEAFFGAAVHS